MATERVHKDTKGTISGKVSKKGTSTFLLIPKQICDMMGITEGDDMQLEVKQHITNRLITDIETDNTVLPSQHSPSTAPETGGQQQKEGKPPSYQFK